MIQWLRTLLSGGMGREPTGPPTRIRRFGSSDTPIAGCASWVSDELHVTSGEATTVHLFEVAVPDLQQCRLTYRFQLSTERLEGSVYAEMWVRLPARGEFFSRGLDQKVSGTNDYLTVQIPFVLRAGEVADLVKLNLVFEGAGVVRMKDIELLSASFES